MDLSQYQKLGPHRCCSLTTVMRKNTKKTLSARLSNSTFYSTKLIGTMVNMVKARSTEFVKMASCGKDKKVTLSHRDDANFCGYLGKPIPPKYFHPAKIFSIG